MKITVFHGSPRKGNTYYAVSIFMDELSKYRDVHYTEFFLPNALPAFCIGCTQCLGGLREKCPNVQYVSPIMEAILSADALIFATPHYGACSMPASMKTLFDHLDFLVLNVLPREEIFSKKAFIITTGAGSAAAIKPIKNVLKHWGINRVNALAVRLFTNKWEKMPKVKQSKKEKALRRSARKFYKTKKGYPYLTTIFFYYMSRFILKKFVGEGNAPFDYWKENGYFDKRPF